MPRNLAITLFLLLAISAAGWFLPASDARAQTLLTLADFDAAGLDVEILVLIQANDTITNNMLWARGRFGSEGGLLDGGASGAIPMLSAPAHPDDPDPSDGNLIAIRRGASIRINDDGGLHLGTYVSATGAGNDLRVYFQTADDGVASTALNGNLGNVGGNFANITLNTETEAVANAISGGERYIFALARPSLELSLSATANPRPWTGSPSLPWTAPPPARAATLSPTPGPRTLT